MAKLKIKSYNLDSNTVAHYKLNDNEANTTVIDRKGTNATLVGGDNTSAKSVTGLIQRAFNLNGSDDYINTNQTFLTTFRGSFSISCWVKFDDGRPSANQFVFGVLNAAVEDYCQMYLASATGRVYFNYCSNTHAAATVNAAGDALPDGATGWYHFVCVVDSTLRNSVGASLYQNSVLTGNGDTTAVVNSDFDAGVLNVFVGSRNYNLTPSGTVDGQMDDFRVFNKALSVAEVKALYNRGRGTENPNPSLEAKIKQTLDWDLRSNVVAQYKMNDNLASTAVINEYGTDGVYNGQNTVDRSVSGKTNRCLQKTLSTDYINTQQTFQTTFSASHSVSGWFRANDGRTADYQFPIGHDTAGGSLHINEMVIDANSGKIGWYYRANSAAAYALSANAMIPDGDTGWFHFVAVMDSTVNGPYGVKVYFNGELVTLGSGGEEGNTTGIVFSTYNCPDSLFLGARNANGTPIYPFYGYMDNICIFNRVITADEVKGLYNQGRGTELLCGNLAKPAPTNTWNLSANTVLQYKMNDNASSTVVVDSQGTNGTLVGGDNTSDKAVVGKIQGALRLNGTDDYIDTNQLLLTTFRSSFSISCWVNLVDGQPAAVKSLWGTYNSSNDCVYLQMQNTGGIIVFQYAANTLKGTTAKSASAVFPNNTTGWQHVVCVADSTINGVGGKKIYVNGAVVVLDVTENGSTLNQVFASYSSANNMTYGAIMVSGSPTQWCAGDYDDFRIFNKALTEKEIWGLYNTGRGTEKNKDLG